MEERPVRSTALPLYLQISEILIREIAAGRLVDGQRLPPERAFARQYGTTVRTLRKALAVLEEKALLVRVHGSGNYIRSRLDIDSIYAMFRLELREGGGLPTAQIINVAMLEKPADLPDFGTSCLASRIRRLRLLNNLPVAIEEIWLDGSVGRACPTELPTELSDSLYLYYRKHLNLKVTRAEDRVAVAAVPYWRPQEFAPCTGHVVGYIERKSWAAVMDHQLVEPVEFSRSWFDPQRARYVQRFK